MGKAGNNSPSYPVKISVSSTTTTGKVLVQARKLRNTDKLKTVFTRPARSQEERATHKFIVEELKRKKEVEPDKHHLLLKKAKFVLVISLSSNFTSNVNMLLFVKYRIGFVLYI